MPDALQLLIDAPRTLANQETLQQRIGMLELPRIAPLTEYVRDLRAEGFGDVPYFDPMDGGVEASSLFLFEKPGPMASSSGFISRNNNDKTAENTYNFMEAARIDRATTCLWNAIPGWNGTIKTTSAELRRGATCLHRLFALLRNFTVVLLVGKKAQTLTPLIDANKVAILSSYHPSPQNYRFARERWESIPREWEKVHTVPTR